MLWKKRLHSYRIAIITCTQCKLTAYIKRGFFYGSPMLISMFCKWCKNVEMHIKVIVGLYGTKKKSFTANSCDVQFFSDIVQNVKGHAKLVQGVNFSNCSDLNDQWNGLKLFRLIWQVVKRVICHICKVILQLFQSVKGQPWNIAIQQHYNLNI